MTRSLVNTAARARRGCCATSVVHGRALDRFPAPNFDRRLPSVFITGGRSFSETDVSVRDAFWDRASHEWLGKQIVSVADTFLAHAAGIGSTAKARELRRMAGGTHAQLLCSPHPLARALAAHRPGRPVSCRSLTTEMLDAPSRGATFLYRDRWQRVPDHVHWVPAGENPSYSAFMPCLGTASCGARFQRRLATASRGAAAPRDSRPLYCCDTTTRRSWRLSPPPV